MARILFFAFCFFTSTLFSQKNGVDVLKMMHEMHGNGKWTQTKIFQKKVQFFKDDLPTDSTIWHTVIQFPNKIRVDFETLSSGHSTIWNRDSAFIFENNQLTKSFAEQNEMLFLLGGWHSFSLDSMVKKLAMFKFDATQPVKTAGFKNKTCWIVGDIKLGGNEIWIEQNKLLPMRILTQTHGTNDEVWVENYVRLQRGFCEGKVTFYQDGHKIRQEIYDQIRSDKQLDDSIFEPKRYRARD
jgi:hypothetical protein